MALVSELTQASYLSDKDLEEMADLAKGSRAGFDLGFISKQREEWVLVTRCYEDRKLRGWLFSTLERIGGTPCILLGVGYVADFARTESVVRSILTEQYKKAILAFPDEDVLVGGKFCGAPGYVVFKNLTEVVPRPKHEPTGEERAWGRRLAKRLGEDAGYSDREFVVTGRGEATTVFEVGEDKVKLEPEVRKLFARLDAARHDSLIVFGWAMIEFLARIKASAGAR